jgi:fumarylacetoacetate (FAA) hydrolase family protein
MRLTLDRTTSLPIDAGQATLVGRTWLPGKIPGPAAVLIRGDDVIDISRTFPTLAELMSAEAPVPAARAAGAAGRVIGEIGTLLANSSADTLDATKPYFLAPCDLQPAKACGVTFATSLLERVIEEHARGNPAEAKEIRRKLLAEIGTDVGRVKPGSAEAAQLKRLLMERGLWSQYLEVGVGPDAEVFTKAPPLASVGTGAEIGILARSSWNNPEPEVVAVVNARGEIVGATLGNDVNLRDFEGRSALLLGRSKENNASSAIGPFVRLFDEGFSIDDVRRMEVALAVEGDDQFTLRGKSSMSEISRDPTDLVRQTLADNHDYPDGVLLYLGTMFAPTKDRDKPGEGFTHKLGDIVTISTPKLGALVNRVNHCDKIAPHRFGVAALMHNLAARGLL